MKEHSRSIFVSLAMLVMVFGVIVPTDQAAAATTPDVKVAFIGDQGLGTNPMAVLQLVKDEGAQALFHPGDFDYADNPVAWDVQMTQVLGADFLVFGTVGNHDVTMWTGYQQVLQRRLLAHPEAVCTGDLGVKSSCHWNGLFFILSGVGTLGTGHEAYIQSELANDDSVWSMCVWHKNQQAMQIGGKTDEVGWTAYETCREEGAFIATAHEHSYERTKTLTSMTNQVTDPAWPNANTLRVAPGSTFAFVSGLAGNSIRDQSRCLPATPPYGCNGEWANIQASNQGTDYGALFCSFNVGGVEGLANCYFKDIQGRVLDTFTITSHMGPNPPAACQDGVDNDADGRIDFPDDASCASASDDDEANVVAITLSGSGHNVKGKHVVDLTWTGATGSTVDVKRNNAQLLNTANDGAYTDVTGTKGHVTFSYQVCASGTTTCSNTVTVKF